MEKSSENINKEGIKSTNYSENDPIIVSATKTKTKVSNTPSHTTLINQTDISKKNYPLY